MNNENENFQENIELLNEIFLSSDFFLNELAEKFKEIKDKLETNMTHEISVEISNIFDRITSDFVPNYQIEVNKYITFFDELNNLSGGIQYNEILSILKSQEKKLPEKIKKYGLSLIKKKPSRLVGKVNSAKSIQNFHWIEIISSLKNNTRFINSALNLKKLIKTEIEKQFNVELNRAKKKYPILSEQQLIEFKKKYLAEKISIEEYLTRFAPKALKTEELKSKSIEKKETKFFDEKQENKEENIDFDNYKKYLQASDRELSRMKRMGSYHAGKKQKKSRRIKKNNGEN